MSFEDVCSLQRIAERAPSPHNTQPWKLIYRQDRIRLDYDPERHLEASDPTKRDLLLSLGSFVESFLIASSEARCAFEFVPDIDLGSCRIGWLRRAATCYKTPFRSSDILKRQTSRLPYRIVPIDVALEQSLQACLSPGERISYVRGSAIRDLLGPADQNFFDTSTIAREFRQWARLTSLEIVSHQDGLSADCLALNPLEARLLSFLLGDGAYPWFRRLRLSTILSAVTRKIVQQDAQLIALTCQSGNLANTLKAGRSLMRLWLTLSIAGIYTHPLSQILDFPDTYQRLSERLECEAQEAIICVFRFGASEPPAASRRSAKVLHRCQLGNCGAN